MTAVTRFMVLSLTAAYLLYAGGGRPGLLAQQRAPDASTLEAIQIRSNVFVIFGAGGNVTVHVGDDGVILVDSGSAAMADRLLQTVRALTPKPVRLIINTSGDADHAGGNDVVARAGVPISTDSFSTERRAAVLAHENVLLRLSTTAGSEAVAEASWPTETYTSRTRSMYLNDDAVQVMRQVGAHSDGDSIVLFRRADVIATGDILDLRRFPMIDPARGGSIQGELDALNHLLELTVPAMPLVLKEGRTLLVPGRPDRRLQRAGRIPRHGHRRARHYRGHGQEGPVARPGEGRESDAGLPPALRS
jgi:glyoxylase-like metal-dependent hydrolase (beta-lactamase superfamily II)